MHCAIWYHLYNLKNVKKNPWRSVTFTKVTLFHGCFSRFVNCTNGTKSRNASHMKRPKRNDSNNYEDELI